MANTCIDWTVTLVFAYMLYSSWTSKHPFECGTQPISAWFTGIYMICFIIRVISHLLDLILRYTITNILFIFIISALLVFTIIWNILGTIWLVSNIIYGNNCLNGFFFILFVIIQFVIYLSYGFLFFFIVKYLMRLKVETTKTNNLKESLLKFYQSPKSIQNNQFESLMTSHSDILKSLPLLEIEKDVIKNYFSEKVVETNEDESCGICMENYAPDSYKSKIQCSHDFHYDCLVEWYKVKPQCPFCRVTFRESLLRKYYSIEGKENNL